MAEREARVGMNEALFRAVNERIEDVNESFATLTDAFEVVCECGDAGCLRQIRMASDAYERVRAGATLFIVVPGHETAEIEDSRQSPSRPGCEIATSVFGSTARSPRGTPTLRRERRAECVDAAGHAVVGSDRDWDALREEVDDTGTDEELSVRKPNLLGDARATVSTRPECLGTPEAGRSTISGRGAGGD
jgi:hypothetical protein